MAKTNQGVHKVHIHNLSIGDQFRLIPYKGREEQLTDKGQELYEVLEKLTDVRTACISYVLVSYSTDDLHTMMTCALGMEHKFVMRLDEPKTMIAAQAWRKKKRRIEESKLKELEPPKRKSRAKQKQ